MTEGGYDETEAAAQAEAESRALERVDSQRAVIEQRRGVLSDERTVDQLIERRALIADAMKRAMIDGVHYGKIPGINKPTLLKPGAELLCSLFMFDPEYESERVFEGTTRHGEPHLLVLSRCTIWHAPSGTRVASGEGMCSTREEKYRWRQGARMCPVCKQPTIIKGKAEYGGGWLCFRKKGGCGEKWEDGTEQARAFAEADVGRVENDRIADTYNTVVKMANKRALVAAVLNATAASDVFTQDVEPDEVEVADAEAPPAEQRIEHAAGEPRVPKNWAEVRTRLAHVLGGGQYGSDTADAIIDEAAHLAYGEEGLQGLKPGAPRSAARQKFGSVVIVLEAGGEFPPPDREEVQRVIARVFEGIAILGPPWAMSPEEDRPSHAEWHAQELETEGKPDA